MKKIIKKIFIGCLLLIITFCASFVAADIYLENQSEGNSNNKVTTSSGKEKENTLGKNTKVSLYTAENKEKELSIDELKNEFGLEGEVTEEVLSKALEEKGYELENKAGNEITYTRDTDKSLEPNKYYIMEYDGYLAIYKCNDDGKLEIEDKDTDVYSEKKQFKDLPSADQEQIKKYQRKFDNKEDAEDGVLELIS